MSFFSPVLAPAILADIPPPLSPRSPIGLVCLLIFCAVSFVALRKLFRRRSKNRLPSPEEVTKE